MENTNLKPVIRFPEFTENWKIEYLGNLMTFKNGVNASKEDYGSGYKFINVLDIIENNFIKYDDIKGEVNISLNEFNRNIVEFGDILFQRSSETREEVGQSNVYLDENRPATFGGFVIRGKKTANYLPVFMHYLLKTSSARKEITTKSGGSTRYNVGQASLSEVTINVTDNLDEQKKIADFLTSVESRITSLKEKKDALLDFKKGVMQKIFNQDIHFKDDNGNNFPDWKEKKMGEICEISKGKQLNKEELTEFGKYPCQNGGVSPSGYTEEYNTPENTITISEGGNSCGYINFMQTKFWCGGHCYAIINSIDYVDNHFLLQLLKFRQSSIMRLRVGSGLPNIQKKDLNNFKIKIPSLAEQIKISNYLTALDDKIETLQYKIEASIDFKKGLLQKMFV